MHLFLVALVAALAATASASPQQPDEFKASVPAVVELGLGSSEASPLGTTERRLGDDSRRRDECRKALRSLRNSIPRPPPEIAAEFRRRGNRNGPCSFRMPERLRSQYDSYMEKLRDWASDKDRRAILESCSDLDNNIGACQDDSGRGGNRDDGSRGDDDRYYSAAARLTGVSIVAAAAAGLAAAML